MMITSIRDNVMINRRNFLVGAVAITVVPIIPTVAIESAVQPITDTTIDAEAWLSWRAKNFNDVLNMRKIVEQSGIKYFMDAPIALHDGIAVEARTRALRAGYSQALIQDLKAITSIDVELEIQNVLADQIGQEFRWHREFQRNEIALYDISPVVAADPHTYEPLLGFKTRFANLGMIF